MSEEKPTPSQESAARFLALAAEREQAKANYAAMTDKPRRRRGRPVGAKNKIRHVVKKANDETVVRHIDPHSLIERALMLVDEQLNSLRVEMAGEGAVDGTKRLLDVANSLCRCIDSLRKYNDLADELQRVMSPEQLLEAAIVKLEGQDLKILNYAIKRLRAHRERVAPAVGSEHQGLGVAADDKDSATSAIASLETE